jgi:TonB-dependent receptor
VWVETQLNDRTQRLVDNNYSVDLITAARYNAGAVVTDENHNVIDLYTAATAPTATSGAGAIFGTNHRDFDYEQDSKYYSTGFNWNLNSLKISALGVHSTASTDSEANSISIGATIPNLRVKLDPNTGVPKFTFPTGVDPMDPNIYNAGPGIQYRPEEVESSEDQAKLDFDWEVDVPVLKVVEFGGQYRTARSLRYAGGGYTTINNVVPSANVTTNVTVGPVTNLSNPAVPVWDLQRVRDFVAASTFLTSGTFFDNNEVSRDGIPNAWLTPGFGAAADYFDMSGFNHDSVRSVNGIPQIPAHDIEEQITAYYLKGNFATEVFGLPLTGNAGARYTETRDDATGSNTIRERRPTSTGGTQEVTVGVQTVTLNNQYRDVLPSFNMSLQIRPNLVSRFGWAKVLARPKPTDLVPNANCLYDVTPGAVDDSFLDTCTAGNPDLLPYRATQYDLDIGWYPNPDTLLSAALFYKDVKTFVLGRTLVPDYDLFGDGRLFDVRLPINGAGAKLSGIELSAQTAFTFLPKPFDGLGTVLNYTYNDAKDVGLFNSLTGEELGFPGLSKDSYNVILYYDIRALDVRLAYNSRTSWLQEATDRGGNPLIRDGSAYLDGKITYRFAHPEVSLFFEAKNLTGETERTTSGDIRLAELSYPGKRYFVGVSYKH